MVRAHGWFFFFRDVIFAAPGVILPSHGTPHLPYSFLKTAAPFAAPASRPVPTMFTASRAVNIFWIAACVTGAAPVSRVARFPGQTGGTAVP